MGRVIGGVVLGYITLALLIFAGLSLAYIAVGADGAFRPGSYDVSTLWAAVSFIVSFLAALAAGWVARRIARTPGGPRGLVVLVLLLAAVGIVMSFMVPPEAAGPRIGTVGTFEAMQNAHTPLWMMLVNPLIGVVGILIGGNALKRMRADADMESRP